MGNRLIIRPANPEDKLPPNQIRCYCPKCSLGRAKSTIHKRVVKALWERGKFKKPTLRRFHGYNGTNSNSYWECLTCGKVISF